MINNKKKVATKNTKDILLLIISIILVGIYVKIRILEDYNSLYSENCNNIKSMKTTNLKLKLNYIIIDGLRYDKVEKLSLNEEYFEMFEVETGTPTITIPRISSMFTGRKNKLLDSLNVANHTKVNEQSLFDLIECQLYGDTSLRDLFDIKLVIGNSPYDPDEKKEEDILKYLLNENKNLKNKNQNRVIHLNVLDKIGHEFGIYSNRYNRKLEEYGLFLQKFCKLNKNSLVIITSDHGCLDNGNHGGVSKEERRSFLALFKKTKLYEIKKRKKQTKIKQQEILPTICKIMNISKPKACVDNHMKNIFFFDS